MSQEQKNKKCRVGKAQRAHQAKKGGHAALCAPYELLWQPSASIEALKKRAEILNLIRDFFSARGVLEVETPVIGHTSVTDPYIQSIRILPNHYLQTSPEYAMKRLLAAGSGDIYQITKVFRQDPAGKIHNPEFTMLEWYRVGFDHQQLMDEMDDLLQIVLKKGKAERISYQQIFQLKLNINPLTSSAEELAECAKKNNIHMASEISDKDTWLDLLMTHCIEPMLGLERPVFIYNFPASQAALARLNADGITASRFEVYYQGMELANGFHELQNAKEQRQRFEDNLKVRKQLNLDQIPIDENFLQALESGLPNCAGVALGIDRLVMLALGYDTISKVISFDFSRV